MTDKTCPSYRFDEFELDLSKRRLLREGQTVALKPKAFDLLALLVENNGRLVSKDEIFERVWRDQFVEETNLTVNISAIRRALGETASDPRYIMNVSGRGYYFDAQFQAAPELPAAPDVEPTRNGHPAEELAPTVESRRWPLRTLAVATALMLLGGAALAGYFYYWSAQPSAGSLSINRLTATGRSHAAGISPDGKMYAFVQLEPDGKYSVWAAQVDGSGRVPLRGPKEFPISSVQFARDGRRVYFVQFETDSTQLGTLYRVPAMGGVVEKVLDRVSTRVAIAPNDKQIAFIRADRQSDSSHLMVYDTEAGERVLLTKANSEGGLSPSLSWSPDGNRIAVAARTSEKVSAASEIFTVNVATGEMKPATSKGWYSVASMFWTRDPEILIAAVGDSPSELEKQLVEVSINTGEVRKLLADSNAYASLSSTDDGTAFMAIQSTSISNVWVAPADDLAAAKQVTFDMFGKQSGWNSIDWTNDGHIVYSGRLSKSDSIWEMNADGSDQHPIVPEGGRSEYVSLPDDGTFFVFMSSRSGTSEIWRANRDGTGLMALTTGGENVNPHVSPDGGTVVYGSGRGPEQRLFKVPASGGQPVQLTEGPADWARFSPDSRYIACSYLVDGKSKLAIIDAQGGKPLNVFDVPATANFRLSVRWTPDGSAITYRDWLNGIWKQPIDGGEPLRLAGLPAEKLFAYAWSRDGKWFAYSRGRGVHDVVLLTGLR